MTTQRLDGPFAATRRYGAEPLALAFDILTLPFQISNTLTGVPPMEIPVFGQVAPGPGPAPAPVGGNGGGISGTFGVVGVSAFPNGLVAIPGELGYQAITIGGQPFATVRVTWSGTITNTGNTLLSDLLIRLHTEITPTGERIRETVDPTITLAPGASVAVSRALVLTSSDPSGDFVGVLSVFQGAPGTIAQTLGQVRSPVLGRINPVTGISITGTFGT